MFTGVTMVGREPYNLSGFCNCTNLNSIVLPPSVTKIGYCAFQSTSISIIDLKYITDISYSAFYACKQLAGVIDMPNLVTKNIITVFADTAINEVKNLGKVERLGNDSFNNGNFTECTKLEKVNLPDTLTYIGRYEFSGCTSLRECNIPIGVTTIIASAFYNCSNLRITINLPNLSSVGLASFFNTGI